MLKLTPDPTFTTEVSISVPGQSDPERVMMEFRYQDRSAMTTWLEESKEQSDFDALSAIVVGWSEVDTPFSGDALQRVLDAYPTAAGEIFRAYAREVYESKVKN